MRPTLLIAAKDLRLRLRDRSAIIIGVVVPFVLAFIFSLILGDADQSGGLDLSYGVVDGDASEISTGLVSLLESIEAEGLLGVERLDDPTDARALVDDGTLGAVILIPEGFGAAAQTGGGAVVEVIGDVDRPLTASIAESIASGFIAEIDRVRLAVAAVGGGDVAALVEEVRAAPPPVSLSTVDAASRQLDSTTFFVAGMAIFFLFFTVQIGVTSLLEEKREGTMARLLAAPISRGTVVGAKAVVSMILGIVSMTVLVVASTLLLGADWGDPVGVAVLVLAGVVSASGIMAVVAAFAKTPEGAGNLQAVIAVGLGMLGGIFFPTPLGEGVLAKLSLLTPHRWFMTGLGDLAGGGGIAVIVPSVLALLAFGLVAGALAGLRLRRTMLT